VCKRVEKNRVDPNPSLAFPEMTLGFSWPETLSSLDHQSQAHEKIIMSFLRVNVKIHRLVRAILHPGPFQFEQGLVIFPRAILLIEFQPPRIDKGQ